MGNAACHSAERKDEYPRLVGKVQRCRRRGLEDISACAGSLDLQTFQCRQRLQQTAPSPIEDVIVGEHTAVDACSGEAVGILGTHAVIDAFSGIVVATGNGRLQVNDTSVWPHPIQFIQRGAPNVRRFGVSGNWAIRLLGQTDIVLCRSHVVFVECWVTGVREHLINASSGHDAAAQEQPY